MAGVIASITTLLYNINTFYALILGLVIGLIAYRLLKDRKYNLPPGPRPLPILGNLLLFKGHPNVYQMISDLSKKHGPVVSLDFVAVKAVVLHSPETALEMLVKKSVDFAGRPKLFSLDVFSEGGNSIVLGQFGPRWQLHRKMASQALSHSIDDEDFLRFNRLFETLTTTLGNGFLADIFPFLQYFPLKQNRAIKDLSAEIQEYLQSKIDNHRATLDPDDLRDLTDYVLQAKREADEEDSENAAMLKEVHIRQTIGDVFGAGVDTTRQTIYWALYFMASHPGVQKKVQDEIDVVVGLNRLPALKDKGKLIYTEATMHEVMRLGPVAPLGVPHVALCDSSIAGYDIPKGTPITVNFYALNHDPEYWKDPKTFNPERFLDEDGKMAPKPPCFMPFSAGRRVCLGESLAKPELFLIFSCIMQKFCILFADGKGPEFKPRCLSNAYRPPPYEVLFQERDE